MVILLYENEMRELELNLAAKKEIHVWEKCEIVLEASKSYQNPYTEVEVWIDLKGPEFDKRIYGFWDGENIFRIRIVAVKQGVWSWMSGSNQADSGLIGKNGMFIAVEWSEEEKKENICRRGFIKSTSNQHAFEHTDGTPFFLIGDTWWATPTFRYKWNDDDIKRPVGPEMGFKDMVKFRKKQGYNCIAMIAAFPAWSNDGRPEEIWFDEDTGVRNAWKQAGTESAKDMHNEGGRPFLFPGKVPGYEEVFPDVDRINPDYFRYMDRKIDYLNEQGYIPFIEVARRDISHCWKKFYIWPDSYSRFIQYIFSRYQANNCFLSPIHFDWEFMSIKPKEYNFPINLVIEKYGPPPFGTLLGTNASPSSLVNFGYHGEAQWLTFHQIGNAREHDYYWYLTEIFNSRMPRPALNGEPYYPGFPEKTPVAADSEEANLNSRSGMYGSFLSGGLGGHIYGVQGLWGGDIEQESRYKAWEVLQFESGNQMQYLKEFALSEGLSYQKLIPMADLITPNKAGEPLGYRGWAYCAYTEERDLFFCYFEKECPISILRGLIPYKKYRLQWFDPCTGEWLNLKQDAFESDGHGRIHLPQYPSNGDWGLKVKLIQAM